MNRKKSCFLIILVTILIIGCTTKFDKAQREKQEAITLSVSEKISTNLDELINILLKTLQEPADINTQNFNLLSQGFPEITALFLYDNNLELTGKVPSAVIDDDIIENCLTHQNIKNISSITKPLIGHSLNKNTDVFICITIPFLSDKTEKRDIIIVLVNTEKFFSRIEDDYITPYPYSLVVINDEQDVVYDSDPMRIGRDFLTKKDSNDYDLALGNLYNMMTENANDFFITNIQEQEQTLKKIYTWNTIYPYGETFYITLVRNVSRNTSKKTKNIFLLSSLRSYAIQDTLIDPIIDDEPEQVRMLLRHIYDNNPEAYVIQLADTTGTIINGWPSCNSIVGYCNAQKRNKSFDNALFEVISTKKEIITTSALLEGGEGKVMFIPILVHEELYGVLIAIEPEGN
ncbi:MAG: hypothetical protein JW794_06015 [Candidatus Cloacimonetes bacterium]|nr:hypothetical protein [Candidatus Cloacimonadota bacterium]